MSHGELFTDYKHAHPTDSLVLLSADLMDLALGHADFVEPDELLVPPPPVVDPGVGRISKSLTPLQPRITCMLEGGEKGEKRGQCFNLFI